MDVWSSAADNAYSNVSVSEKKEDQLTNDGHTRIYMFLEPTIKLSEMSMPLNDIDADAKIDPSTGLHELGNDATPGKTSGNQSTSVTMDVGVSYPLIRINDHYYTHLDIQKFTLSTAGFIPTIELMLTMQSNDILKSNQIKDGDKVAVFINPGHGMIKSYRGDYIITSSKMFSQSQLKRNLVTTCYIRGELYIPNLYSASMTDVINGTSRDALIEYAKRLGLGFFFCDEENTADFCLNYCVDDGVQRYGDDPPMLKAIKEIAACAYKDFNSFYDCWIDPRYGLTFLNVNKMLGYEGLDENIDIAFYNNAMTNAKGIDAEKASKTDAEKKADPIPQVKILSNLGNDTDAMTAFFVTSWKEINNAATISNSLGLGMKTSFNLNNTGLENKNNAVEFNYSIPVNKTKLENGFYILAGPGTNLTYAEGDNGSFVELHTSSLGGTISEAMSPDSENNLRMTGDNMLSDGNTNRWKEIGFNHNLLNNKWLEKKMIKVTLNGCNMQMMRGEKIPMILLDNQMGMNLLNINERNAVSKRIFETGTGWFIIKSLKWIYDANNKTNMGTAWKTEIVLTRREWPIIGYNKEEIKEEDSSALIITQNNPASDSIKEGVFNNAPAESTETPTENTTNDKSRGEINTNGLKGFMITIYNDIKNAVQNKNGSIMLISGRRWAADENDNKIEGEPKVQEGSSYKFINSVGDIVWYNSKTSRHLYGEAIDIINGLGFSFEGVLDAIIGDFLTVYDMYSNGVYCAVEVTKDDTGNSVKHYHIGTVDLSSSDSISGQGLWWTQVKKIRNSETWSFGGKTINFNSYKSMNK